MSAIHLRYEVPGDDFTRAGEASSAVKKRLKALGYNSDAIRRVAIAMYEAEINMVIHAEGGYCDVDIYPDRVEVLLADKGPGIPDVEKAMQAGFSTGSGYGNAAVAGKLPLGLQRHSACYLP